MFHNFSLQMDAFFSYLFHTLSVFNQIYIHNMMINPLYISVCHVDLWSNWMCCYFYYIIVELQLSSHLPHRHTSFNNFNSVESIYYLNARINKFRCLAKINKKKCWKNEQHQAVYPIKSIFAFKFVHGFVISMLGAIIKQTICCINDYMPQSCVLLDIHRTNSFGLMHKWTEKYWTK